MKISQRGLDLIKKFEGFSPVPYLCPAGVPTIGYGTTYYEEGLPVTIVDKVITEEMAEDLLKKHVETYENGVNQGVKQTINQNQFDALVSFTYNVGVANFLRSTLLKKVNIDPYDLTIETEFLKWVNAGGKRLTGLVKRRQTESQLYYAPYTG